MEKTGKKTVHGHEVMHMMINSGRSYTREELCREIVSKFGEETRFYTCSANDMTAEQLIDFLNARGKFLIDEKGFTTDPERICNH